MPSEEHDPGQTLTKPGSCPSGSQAGDGYSSFEELGTGTIIQQSVIIIQQGGILPYLNPSCSSEVKMAQAAPRWRWNPGLGL